MSFQMRVCVEDHEFCYMHDPKPGYEGTPPVDPNERMFTIDGTDLVLLLQDMGLSTDPNFINVSDEPIRKISLMVSDDSTGVKFKVNDWSWSEALGREGR